MGDLTNVYRLNGKGLALLKWVIGLAIAGVVGYFASIGNLERSLSAVEARENSHFEEVQRSLNRIEADIRELRADVRGGGS